MRYILALIIALPLLAVSLEADAGLVEDLRSGKSKVKASSNEGTSIDAYQTVREQKSAAGYKVVTTSSGWVYRISDHSSAEQAVEAGLRYCTGHSRQVCRVFAVSDTIVQAHSQAKLADVIEAYQLEVSGNTATKPKNGNFVYCRRDGGNVYSWHTENDYTDGSRAAQVMSCAGNTEITKAEYDRLKNQKTDTASSVDDRLEAKLEKLK